MNNNKTEEEIQDLSDEEAMKLIREHLNQAPSQDIYENIFQQFYDVTKSTEQNESEKSEKSENQKKIFDIKKVNKNKGRRKQSHPELYKEDAVHTKFREDNIINKIKIYFINSTMSLINKKYSEYIKAKSSKRLLQKIKPNYSKIYKKKETQEFFMKEVKEIFSEELSGRCSTFEDKKNYNKIQIDTLIEKNKAKEVINLLNKRLEEIYEIYITNDPNKKIEGYHLENDLEQIKLKNGDDYAKMYKETAVNLLDIINNKRKKVKFCI
jgi:membrane-associated HD superfamily phosphohydrolase